MQLVTLYGVMQYYNAFLLKILSPTLYRIYLYRDLLCHFTVYTVNSAVRPKFCLEVYVEHVADI